MVERLLLKSNLSFSDVELFFSPGLVVFTGASGAGKSILTESILALFGLKEIRAEHSEITIDRELNLEDFDSDELTIIKAIKKDKTRFFINGQSAPKRQILSLCSSFVRYINNKERDDFSQTRLISHLDRIAVHTSVSHGETLEKYRGIFEKLKELRSDLLKIEEEEMKIEQLKELAEFEIQKIEQVAPNPGEYEELMGIKKKLSKKEKIEQAIDKSETVFELESDINHALELIDEDSTFIDEAFNALRICFENARSDLQGLDETDIESILNRIEQLSDLQRKYGSIEGALEHLDSKKSELKHFENISFEKENLQKEIVTAESESQKLSKQLTVNRQKASKTLEKELAQNLRLLYLHSPKIALSSAEASTLGADQVNLTLNGVETGKISSGEFNRLRLALLASMVGFSDEKGVLVLDEIDANISGEESEGVAKVLHRLSQNYQVFAISHQPHLPSLSDQHYLVSKSESSSQVAKLDKDGQIREIARMVSGKEITEEAVEFARKILGEK